MHFLIFSNSWKPVHKYTKKSYVYYKFIVDMANNWHAKYSRRRIIYVRTAAAPSVFCKQLTQYYFLVKMKVIYVFILKYDCKDYILKHKNWMH